MRNSVLCGDSLEKLKELPDKSVHMCVTSPPYYGPRLYDTGKWIGGDPDCKHETVKARGGRGGSGPGGKNTEYGAFPSDLPVKQCSKCGALWEDKQIGQEESPEKYIENLVNIFQEVHRVLRDDGTLWVVIGDSYWGGKGQSGQAFATEHIADRETFQKPHHQTHGMGETRPTDRKHKSIKPKDLIGIPWMTAFALRDAGWVLRRDHIWAKAVSFCPTYSGTCMPEPVTDRATSAHEYIFMFSKSNKPTYWMHRDLSHGTRNKPTADYRYIDTLAHVEYAEKPADFNSKDVVECPDCSGSGTITTTWFDGEVRCESCEGRGKVKRWKRINLWSGEDYFYDADAVREAPITLGDKSAHAFGPKSNNNGMGGLATQGNASSFNPSGRNLRSVWTINPGGYPDAHFATYPPSLIEPMIKLGTSEYGSCPTCGAPWVRTIKKGDMNETWKRACGADTTGEYHGESAKFKKQDAVGKSNYTGFNARWKSKQQNASDVKRNVLNGLRDVEYEWKPSCDCGCEDRVPCIVIDNFGGSGTTGEVARNLDRDYILIELSEEYVEHHIKKRLRLNEQLTGFLS